MDAKIRKIMAHPLICVADVDTRLMCSTYCACCEHYVRERREGQRRRQPRECGDRRVLRRL